MSLRTELSAAEWKGGNSQTIDIVICQGVGDDTLALLNLGVAVTKWVGHESISSALMAQFLAGPNDVKAPVLIKEKEQMLNQGNREYKSL